MATLDVFTFNVNQFSKPEHQKADLLERMRNTSVGLLQETVHLDVAAFIADPAVIAQVGQWDAYQVHHGNEDGHANTAVLWRKENGPAAQKYLVDLGRENTRERYLTCADLPASGFGSGHIFPQRDKAGIPGQLDALHTWRRAHQGTYVLGFDRNQLPPVRLETVTGMTWHGVGIDGFLVTPDVKVRRVRAFPKGFSDHPGVHAELTFPDPAPQPKPNGGTVKKGLIARARDLLRRAVRRNKQSHPRVAERARKGLDATTPTPKPAPTPAPTPPTPSAPHGFMPGAIIKSIPPGSNDPAIIPVGVIQHIAVSNSDSLFTLFSNDGGIESHFYIRKDGTIEQYRSIYFEADAQFAGNSFGSPRKGFVSVEHQGGVGTDLNVPMPPSQLDAFHRVVRWVHEETGFPLRVCPAWDAPGVGYHALFDQWNTNHHSCPGAARIKQFHDVTVPWLRAGGK